MVKIGCEFLGPQCGHWSDNSHHVELHPYSSPCSSKVVPCALASALDIGLSNTSLKSISLTLYTMCKSSNLVFVLAFAFLFGLERIRWNLVGVITVITIGVSMGRSMMRSPFTH